MDITRQALEPQKAASHTLGEAIELYAEVNGIAPTTARHLLKISDCLGLERGLDTIDQSAVDELARKILQPDAADATKRRAIITPLRAVLTRAATRGWCRPPVFEKTKAPVVHTEVMTPAQFEALYWTITPALRPLVAVMVFTGARTGEAFALRFEDFDFRAQTVKIRQPKVKGRVRITRIPLVLVEILKQMPDQDGLLFPDRKQKQIRSGWYHACRRANFEGEWSKEWIQKYKNNKGEIRERKQRRWISIFHPHSLRHTWASWHYCVNRDTMLLRAEGDWSTVAMVERYTKLVSPVYKEEIETFLSLDSPLLKP